MAILDTQMTSHSGQSQYASKTAEILARLSPEDRKDVEEAFAEMEQDFAAVAKPEGQRTVRYGGLTLEDYEEDARMASAALRKGLARLADRDAKRAQETQEQA